MLTAFFISTDDEAIPLTQTTQPTGLFDRLTIFFGISAQLMVVLFLSRLTIDIGTRIAYPFIPQFSEGLGLSIVGFSWLLSLRSLAGLTSPLFGLLADRYGRRSIMTTGLICQSIGTAGVMLAWQWGAVLPMFIFGLSLAAFIPAQQAYVSDQVPYQKRGRSLAAIEFSWATAGIITLPIIGWMIDTFGWQSPFLLLSLLSLSSALFVWFALPKTEHRSQSDITWGGIRSVLQKPGVMASTTISLLLFVAVGCFSTIWGIWLSEDFDLSATALGLVATAIGVAELGGSGVSSLFIDRIGKQRGSGLGLLLTALAFGLLGLTQSTLFVAVAGLVLIGLVIEFSIVSLIPLYSEQVPTARATVFSLVGLGAAIGVTLGSPLAAGLWAQSGLWAVCGVSALSLGLAAGLVYWFLPEHGYVEQI